MNDLELDLDKIESEQRKIALHNALLDLSDVSTKRLTQELENRLGVKAICVEPHEDEAIPVSGPAIVLVITD